VNAGAERNFCSRHAAKLGNSYHFQSLLKKPIHAHKDRFRFVICSGPNWFVTGEQTSADDFVSACRACDCPFVRSKSNSTVFPIEGFFKALTWGKLKEILEYMGIHCKLNPNRLSFHRNGFCEKVSTIQQPPHQAKNKPGVPKILKHYGLDLPKASADIETQMPMTYCIYQCLTAEPEPLAPGIYMHNTCSLDWRIHQFCLDGKFRFYAKHPQARGRNGQCFQLNQVCASLALFKEIGRGTAVDAINFVAAREKDFGGSTRVYKTVGVVDKTGHKSDTRENPPASIQPNTFVAYCHNLVALLKNAFGLFSLVTQFHSKSSDLILTNGQAFDLLQAISRHLDRGTFFDEVLSTSADLEVNLSIGGHTVTREEGGFRRFVIDNLNSLHHCATDNSVFCAATLTKEQREDTIRLLCKQMTDFHYFSGVRGATLSPEKTTGIIIALSSLGLSFTESRWRKYAQTLVSSWGPNLDFFRFLVPIHPQLILVSLPSLIQIFFPERTQPQVYIIGFVLLSYLCSCSFIYLFLNQCLHCYCFALSSSCLYLSF
jgi:hypothetical protein